MACITSIAVTVYSGADNTFALAIEDEDGVLLTSLATLTRATLVVGDTTIDSDVDGSSVVWWTDTTTYRGGTVGLLKFKLGGVGITAGTYTDCDLTIYDATNTNGIRIANAVKVTVE